jgi:predicted nucleotide-binding protein (sugar kinase/HSP70/actin superfamily)
LDKAKGIQAIRKVTDKYLARSKNIKLKKLKHPVRVGMVGELYILMEPFSNFNIEKELAELGVEVHRFVTVSSLIHDVLSFKYNLNQYIKHASPYLKNHIGAHGTESVAKTLSLIKQGFDGVIHVKPFGCMPEVNAMSALYKISKDYKFPIVYFSFDSQTSQAGIRTRLEAFYDMLMMKRKAKKGKR